MAKKRKQYVKLQCTECGKINYFVRKSRGLSITGQKKKLSFKKFCRHCQKHTLHKEVR